MSVFVDGVGGGAFGRATEAAGTPINLLVPPPPVLAAAGYRTAVASITYKAGATPHVITALRVLGRVEVDGIAMPGSAVVRLKAQPGPTGNALAANDWVALRELDGITRLYKVTGVPGSYPGDVGVTPNLVAGTGPGRAFWTFGVAGDTDPATGEPHQQFPADANQLAEYVNDVAGLVVSRQVDEPLLLQSDNATNSGEFRRVVWTYLPRSAAGVEVVGAGSGGLIDF